MAYITGRGVILNSRMQIHNKVPIILILKNRLKIPPSILWNHLNLKFNTFKALHNLVPMDLASKDHVYFKETSPFINPEHL